MNDEMKKVLLASLIVAIGFMWVVGGIALILASFDEHWALGWGTLFIWIWGCTAVGLYFKVQRFFNWNP